MISQYMKDGKYRKDTHGKDRSKDKRREGRAETKKEAMIEVFFVCLMQLVNLQSSS